MTWTFIWESSLQRGSGESSPGCKVSDLKFKHSNGVLQAQFFVIDLIFLFPRFLSIILLRQRPTSKPAFGFCSQWKKARTEPGHGWETTPEEGCSIYLSVCVHNCWRKCRECSNIWLLHRKTMCCLLYSRFLCIYY